MAVIYIIFSIKNKILHEQFIYEFTWIYISLVYRSLDVNDTRNYKVHFTFLNCYIIKVQIYLY